MLSHFRRRSPPDPEQIARIKDWVAPKLSLNDDDHIAIAELWCHDPGCPGFETVVTVLEKSGRRFVLWRPTPVADVTEADVESFNEQGKP